MGLVLLLSPLAGCCSISACAFHCQMAGEHARRAGALVALFGFSERTNARASIARLNLATDHWRAKQRTYQAVRYEREIGCSKVR